MEQCFTDHECDAKRLNRNTQPTGLCERRLDEARNCYITRVPILTCEGLWTRCQREAEDWIAPGGQLIANGVERNRRINAAYAQLWIEDKRFEWAGLAAFASKQVGCGLLHSADIARKIGIERDARRRMEKSGKTTIDLPGLEVRRMDELAVKDWEKARNNNPVPLADIEREGSMQRSRNSSCNTCTTAWCSVTRPCFSTSIRCIGSLCCAGGRSLRSASNGARNPRAGYG